MSKQGNKQRTPGPYDPAPKASRKVSNQGTPKFYDGPTVNAKAEEIKSKVVQTTTAASQQVKKQSKKAVAKARRHPWSILSILTTIPFLITFSLFSTVICPAPGSDISPISKFVLSPLGLHDHSGQHSALHQTLCYPSNVYHEKVLQPYIYPIVDNLQSRATSHPLYVKGIQPAYTHSVKTGQSLWQGPVKPIVTRIQRGARRLYLTFIEPHLPYLKTKYTALTAPYTSRFSAFHRQNIAPHVNTAGRYAQQAGKRSVDTYNYVAAHPLTGHAGRYANQGYQFSKVKSQQAYTSARPHVIRAAQEAERISREILGPRIIKGLEWAGSQVGKGYAVAKLHATRLYYKHLDPYVGTHIAHAHSIISPYVEIIHKKVYVPYIYPLLESILPKAVLAPEPPKSFWALIADILPGSHVAERKNDMKGYRENVKEARKPANVPVPGAEKIAKAESAKDGSKAAKKFDREEMNRVRGAIKERVEQQGKKGYQNVRKELLEYNTHILSDDDKFTALKRNARQELEREFEYILKGLDKLYTTSTTLTKEQIEKSSIQAETRVSRKVQQIKERSQKLKGAWHEGSRPIVQQAFDDLDAALGTEYADLKDKMAWMDDVTQKDWTEYQALKDNADEWSEKYMALHNGESKDRALNAPSANVNRAISSWSSELTDLYENWRDQVRLLKKTASDRVAAREAVAAESSTTLAKVQKASTTSTDNGRVSILPIAEAGAAAAAAAGIIGKGKEQIVDALNQASEQATASAEDDRVSILPIAEAREAAAAAGDYIGKGKDQIVDAVNQAIQQATTSAEDGRVSILPIAEAGAAAAAAGGIIGKGKDQILDALSQASAAAVGSETPSGVVDQAKAAVNSAYEAASSGVHDATRSVVSAIGGTPAPEGVVEHAQSIAAVAGENAQAAYDAAASVVHDATRSAMSAVGASPSPESVNEHLESIANAVKGGYASVADNLGSNIHEATRAGLKAVGATPSPEGIAEHVESLASELSANIASVASDASVAAASLASNAGSVVHEGTRSAGKAIGISPTPETPSEYAESIVSAASASVNSAASAASSAVHDATRAAISAAGGTPSPESPIEYAQSLANVASEAAASVYDQATASAASVYDQAAASAGSAYTAVSSSAGDMGSAITDQAVLLGQQIQEALGLVSTPEPFASSVSAYLAQITGGGAVKDDSFIASGKSLLASIQSQAGENIHSATRAASRAVGATPTPETPGEYVEDAKERVNSLFSEGGKVVSEYATRVSEEVEKVTEGVKKRVLSDEL